MFDKDVQFRSADLLGRRKMQPLKQQSWGYGNKPVPVAHWRAVCCERVEGLSAATAAAALDSGYPKTEHFGAWI